MVFLTISISYGISGDLALQSIDTLSGGQKSRVVFALMGWIKPHFLILDEVCLTAYPLLYLLTLNLT